MSQGNSQYTDFAYKQTGSNTAELSFHNSCGFSFLSARSREYISLALEIKMRFEHEMQIWDPSIRLENV